MNHFRGKCNPEPRRESKAWYSHVKYLLVNGFLDGKIKLLDGAKSRRMPDDLLGVVQLNNRIFGAR